jgi:putative transposase
MRKPRFLGDPDDPCSHYHCFSKVVDGDFKLHDLERQSFVDILRRYARFSQVRVLTYCVLSNHFHLLIEVPRRPDVLPPDSWLLETLREFYPAASYAQIQRRWIDCSKAPDAVAAFKESFWRRMWDLSEFMKGVKQSFSVWYNRHHHRTGTLWEERFGSVLAESHGPTLGILATYIDLNPIRAGLVADPKDYRWSGYAEAVAGHGGEPEALLASLPPEHRTLAAYRQRLYAAGIVTPPSPTHPDGRVGFQPEQIAEVWKAGGQLTLEQLVLCRVRYFVDGAVLGSKAFVNRVFQRCRNRFGPRRTSGARPLRRVASRQLYCLRNLRIRPIG